MSNVKESAGAGGIGFGGVLFIVFLILKLTKVIDWSWWWVTSPLWIPFGIFIVLLIVFIITGVFLSKKHN